MADETTVLVVGAGRLGRCIAAVFADAGVPTLASDKNPTLIESLEQGVVSFPEPQLIPMLSRSQPDWSTDTVAQAAKADVALIVVPTPSSPDGRFDSQYVCSAVRDVCEGFKQRERPARPTIVVISTVMPGSCDNEISAVIRDEGFESGDTIGFAYTPAFIALGNVIDDFKNPDVVMIGCADTDTYDTVVDLYALVVNPFAVMQLMSLVDTEIAKLSVNVFLSLKVAFANTVARVCEGLPGANVNSVLNAVRQDSRIGGRYLQAGSTASGPCLPRDVIAFDRAGGDAMAETVAQADEETISWVLNRVEDACVDAQPGDRPTVTVLGLAYKPDCPVADASLGGEVLRALESAGCYDVSWSDPWDLLPGYANRVSFGQALQSDVIVVGCGHSEYRGLLKAREGQTVVDLWMVASDDGAGAVVRPGVGPHLATSA